MQQCDDRGQPKGDILEPQPDISHDHHQTGQQGVDCRHLGVACHLSTDRVRRQIDWSFSQLGCNLLKHAPGRLGVERSRQ